MLQGDGHNSGSRKRRRRMLAELSAKERLEVVEMVQQQQRTHAEIGEVFNVSTIVINKLVFGVRRGQSSIVKRYAAELKRSRIQVAVVEVVRRLLDAG